MQHPDHLPRLREQLVLVDALRRMPRSTSLTSPLLVEALVVRLDVAVREGLLVRRPARARQAWRSTRIASRSLK